MTLRSWHISTTLVSIGMARCGVRPVVLMVSFRSLGNLSIISRQMSTMSLRVVGSPPESEAFSMSFQRLELKACSICGRVRSDLAIAARPVAAHLAAGVADEGAVEDEDGRVDRRVFRDRSPDEIARRAERRLGEYFAAYTCAMCNLMILQDFP